MFALSQTFVVSANKVTSGDELTPVGATAVAQRLRQLPHSCSRRLAQPDDGQVPRQRLQPQGHATTSPNENYARELLQLFSIGTWDLNSTAARSSTAAASRSPATARRRLPTSRVRSPAGPIRRAPVRPRATRTRYSSARPYRPRTPRRHDTDQKVLLSGVVHPARHDRGLRHRPGDRQHLPASQRAAVRRARLIRSLVTSNPSPAYVTRVSNAFINNGAGVRGDLAAVVRAVLLDPEALTPTMTEHGRLKDPVLHVIGFGRALGRHDRRPQQLPECVLEPEPAGADAGDGLQLLPADGD